MAHAGVAAIVPDDGYAVGICAIKMVTEETVQARAFGPISAVPA